MKNHTKILLTALLCTLGLMAFTFTNKEDEKVAAGPEQWKDYRSWYKVTKVPNTGDPTGFLSKKHRGTKAFREIYMNSVGVSVNKGEADFPYPEGTVVVKEAYKNQADHDAQVKPELTVMVKLAPGTSPTTNDWMFYMGGDGKLSGTGMTTKWGKFCGSCHVNAVATDYTFMTSKFEGN